jgi:type II secretory pathway component GspD/PulD (secretin)
VANGHNAYLQIFTVTNYVRTYTQQGTVFQPEVQQYTQGVEWSVRPVISFDRKYITIRVRPRVRRFDPQNSRTIAMQRTTVITATTPPVVGVVDLPFFLPVFETTELETSVTIPDSGTVLMGGLIRDSRDERISGVPLLSSVPFVGRALRSERRANEKNNLIIMLSGKIVQLDS